MSDYDEFRRALQSELAVVMFFGANCAPCAELKPILTQVCAEKGLQLFFANAQMERPAVQRLALRTVPSVVVISNQAEILLFGGLQNAFQIRDKLARAWII